MDTISPFAGLWNYLFGSALSPFGENRWSERDEAITFRDGLQDFVSDFGMSCNVVDAFVADHPQHRWQVICSPNVNR